MKWTEDQLCGLRRTPIQLGRIWIYEEPRGLSIYSDIGRGGMIPVSTLRAYLRRWEARKAGE